MSYTHRRLLTHHLRVLTMALSCLTLPFGCDVGDEGSTDTSPQAGVMSAPSQGGAVSEPSPATSLTERPFDAGSVPSMLYTCVDASEYTVHLQLSAQGALTLIDDIEGAGDTFNGTYSLSGQTISLNIPALGAPEVARDQTVVFGLLGAFVTTNLYCFAVTKAPKRPNTTV